MKAFWLNKNHSSNLIVFFSGWGMDEKSVILDYKDYDFIVFYDYENFEIEKSLIDEINAYKNVYLIAWSMGVIASTILINKIKNLKQKIAINGTLSIIDDKFGISNKIFDATLNNLSPDSIKMFFKNMGYSDFKEPNRTFESQLNELKNIKTFYKANNFSFDFDKIIISKKDIIVPFKNQKRAWDGKNCIFFDSGHYVFNLFKSWEDIINAR